MIFATMMVACMIGSSVASRIMSRPDMKVERYMQVVGPSRRCPPRH
jgi:hypothetical protein